MEEIPLFFSNGIYELFGIRYGPEKENLHEGFVFIDPFAEEKLWAQRVMVSFARQLCSLGYTVLRFDFMGHGASDGHFEEATIDTRIADIKCAVEFLKENSGEISSVGLLGLRFGATLTMLATEEIPDVSHLILWDPVINGEKYMKEILRANLVTQTAVYKEIRYTRDDLVEQMKNGGKINIEGYHIAYPFFEQASTIDLLTVNNGFDGSGLLVNINKGKAKLGRNVEQFRERYKNFTVSSVLEEPFWKEIKTYYPSAKNLSESTIKWLMEKHA